MDIFGIGSTIRGAVGMYMLMARRSGRTITMVNALKPGDRIFFTNRKEADRVKRLCQERDIKGVSFEVVGPNRPERLMELGTSQGRTIFDHSWVEEYYLNAFDRAEKNIDYFQTELSGYGEPHIKTKLAVKEYHRMRGYLSNFEV